jgi:choline dehydrogenase-like flavoprotein
VVRELSVDVVIVGSGPGGAVAAARLSAAGARVAVLEEGGEFTGADFGGLEQDAYPLLYQEHGARSTEDLSIQVLQGRTVGGGSTVSWMTCFRTPASTLAAWEAMGVEGVDAASLRPHWDEVERRLDVHAGLPEDVNANNGVLRDGCSILGWGWNQLARNSTDCPNLGLCGMGCPVDAKNDARRTYLSDARRNGATVYAGFRVDRIVTRGRRASGVLATGIDPRTDAPTGDTLDVRAGTVVVAGGALNSPALLRRSGLGGSAVGRRTWLHPVVATAALFERTINPWSGSPQSIGSHHFAQRGGRMGFFIETPPVHPMLAALAFPAFGMEHRAFRAALPRVNVLIGLGIDGFSAEEPGGRVRVRRDGTMRLSYPLTSRHREALVQAMKAMARIQLAAGAQRVMSLHTRPVEVRRESEVERLAQAPFGPNHLSMFSAHPMGGCAMGRSPKSSVVDSRGRVHGVDNLVVADGSVFPTSLGVNPMISIYGVASLFASELAAKG